MKGLLRTIKSIRHIEIAVLIAAICILAVACLESDGEKTEMTDREARISAMIREFTDADRVYVMLSDDGCGIVVIAEGGGVDDYLKIQRAVTSVTDIDAESIEIIFR